MARFGGGRWDYNDNEEEGEYKASLSQTVLILVAHFASRPGGLSPWQLCNAAWSIARHVYSFPPSARRRLSHRLLPHRKETKDDVAICLPGAKNARSTMSTWDLRGGGIAIAAARRRDDEDIGDSLSANIDTTLALIALRAA